MEIKAKDMCPRCKYGSELNIGIDVILNCANFEWRDGKVEGKVEGKVADFCPKCKNCKSTTRECDGKKDWLTEVECEDPYDGMIRTLAADSDICCSMFEARPNPTHACYEQEVKTVKPGEKVDIPCTKISLLEHELEMDRLRSEIHQLEKEKAAHMKGIERLKKANNNLLEKCNGYIAENAELKLKCKKTREAVVFRSREIDELQKENEKLKNQIKNLQYLNEEGYKREDKLEKDNHLLESKLDKLGEYYRTDEKLIDNIQKVIFPQEEGSDYTYSYDEILNKVKDLKVQSDENGTMYEDLKYWKERCHNAESDVTTLNSKVEVLEKKFRKVDSIRDAIWNEKELKGEIDNLKEKNENLTKMVERRDRWVNELQSDVYTLQNEVLTIRNIAQKAYDDTNRD